MHLRIFLTLIIWLMATTLCFAGDEPTIRAELNTNSISVEKAALLTVTVTGSRSPELIMPQVPGLTFYSRGTSTMINMINGDFTKSSTTKYVVQADQKGTYTIPPIAAEIKGKIYKSEPLALVVTDNRANSTGKAVSSGSERDEVAFLEVEIDGDHYIGEQVAVTIRGFFSQRYKISLESVPTLVGDGVIMTPFNSQPTQSRARIGNTIYDVVDWKTTLSAIKEGDHKLQFKLNAAVYTREQNSNPFNDPFFDSFFSNTKKTPLEVSSKEYTFTALALPLAGQPENFSGAVGEFNIQIEADPIIVDVGEPITITTTITGKGSFDSVHTPVFPENDDWKTYKPATLDINKEERGQKKVFQQVIVPKKDSIEEVPALAFSFFNTKKKAYETSISKPVAIHVKENKAVHTELETAVENSVEKSDKQQAAKVATKSRLYKNLVPQHLETGVFHETIEPVFKKIWFIALVVCCLVLILIFAIFHIYSHFQGNNPEKELKKKQRNLIDKQFPQLETLCQNDQTDEFLHLAKDTIQKFYSLELNLPQAGITAASLEDNKLNDTVAKTILESADRVAFSGQRPDKKQMINWLNTLKKELVR